ncbi:hypothetical protein OHA77_08085 [Streptosporangium sp. NBC_01639]|uniref:hypothetical protein n=1 Tax=unclassified Streptosporangium TaxID=2632669 RepID=UPI002DDB0AB9|nr:hypothetical protein [Streptosporangium sp. NBC_01756]WSC84876.1 hypothetical protein OIE48_31565 [Streptosporangium sp. NBC_01756]WTD56477.1 hypothetical protein OHA77_08085 [Streptosporangium sp. NBC_01639]
MTWHWRYENANGGIVTEGVTPSDTFPSQADAESWLGESWRELLESGVEKVTLLDGDRVEYEKMSLRAE